MAALTTARAARPLLGPAGGPTGEGRPARPLLGPAGGPTGEGRPARPLLGPAGGPTVEGRPARPLLGPAGGPTGEGPTPRPYVRCPTLRYLQRRARLRIPVDGSRRGAGRSCRHGRQAAPAQRNSRDPIVPDLPRPPAPTDDDPRRHPTRRGRAGELRPGPLEARRGGAIPAPNQRLRLIFRPPSGGLNGPKPSGWPPPFRWRCATGRSSG